MEGIDGLKGEVLASRSDIGYTEEEYWETILSLSWNTLTDLQTLAELRTYYETHDASVLGDKAENVIMHWYGLTKVARW